jgi:acyl carrier protein
VNEQLRALVAEMLDLDVQQVHHSLQRRDTDRWDSLNHLRLVTAIEQTFLIKLSMHEIQSAESVADLDDILKTHGVPE